MAEARKISMRGLKALALKELPPGSPLREVILGDTDEISEEAFIHKLDVWMRLLNMETRKK